MDVGFTMIAIDAFSSCGKYLVTYESCRSAEKLFAGCYLKINRACKANSLPSKPNQIYGKAVLVDGYIWRNVPEDLQIFALKQAKMNGGWYIGLRPDLDGVVLR